MLCEDCIFLREFEKELTGNLDEQNNRLVLEDYDTFGTGRKSVAPFKWLESIIIMAFVDQEEILLDEILAKWKYSEVDLEKDVIPKFVEWGFLKAVETIERDGKQIRILKLGAIIDDEFKRHLSNTLTSGRMEGFSPILKLLGGRINLGVETGARTKDLLRWKLMKVALKQGFNKDGSLKNEIKVNEAKDFSCKICGERMNIRYKLYEHVSAQHPELTNGEKDAAVVDNKVFKGIKIAKDDILSVDEIGRYQNKFRERLLDMFKAQSFFDFSVVEKDDEDMVISAPWAMVMEKVNLKVKDLIKTKEKVKTIEGTKEGTPDS